MKPIIQKEIDMPELTTNQINTVTELTFGKKEDAKVCDAIFVFAGTHPGHWEKAIEAYDLGLAPKIIVTGGRSLTGHAHPDWTGRTSQTLTEASVIISNLIQGGIPEEIIEYEDQSTNSLENVLYAKALVDFSITRSLLIICKGHAAGRQIRTLKKHFPEDSSYIPYPFETSYGDIVINRDNWMDSEVGRKRVWGEYQRILHYGLQGHLVAPSEGQLI
ncbi:YdcF family protein [Rossellomorea aquimaris]|uniref:YdcF family protein n=1 Tax=Rossellomorea aquimaris TaxID=189382 RepID=UPI001CD5EDFF|nr:YdcF family protein [Rossellomorea aquimaris]MCA1053686.1 YdcF family protein [Rossellomorea aquimaris]